MKSLIIKMLCLCTVAAYGQEMQPEFDGHTWEAPYTLATPEDWGIERFLIPISFAPQISYKGVEDIRFAPGWAKVNSEEYWSYAFLWYLEGDIKTDNKTIESNLKVYYTGLIASNGSAIAKEKLIPVITSFTKTLTDNGDTETFTGTVEMLDYMQQKPIILNCKTHLRYCSGENKTFIFYELSPQSFSNNTWLGLDKLWIDFKCPSK